MNQFTQWLLLKICRRLVRQDLSHKQRIAAYYDIMREAALEEFTEDNTVTVEAFLRECFEETCRAVRYFRGRA